ncbi:hypothetical protein F5884DRAFT_759412 [Xylogone sp. PMI_703]|nr:hypothetical protein F5884DRAFT_759412 [Xylogone sp. PMI_703]
MTLNFLTDIPRELRDKIYVYVLGCASVSDPIPLFPRVFRRPNPRRGRRTYNPSAITATSEEHITVHLALLLTCKQIRGECKDLIWFYNGLWIPGREETALHYKLERYCGSEQFRLIRSVVVRLELLDWEELTWFSRSLHPLITPAGQGTLRSIKLLAKTDRLATIRDFVNLSNLRKHCECVDGRWYRVAQWSSQQVRYHRNFVINTGWPRFSDEKKQRWIREILVHDVVGMDVLLEDLNEMFGGEIYVDGCLCFKDRIRTRSVICWNPRDGEIEIRPVKSLGEQQTVVVHPNSTSHRASSP